MSGKKQSGKSTGAYHLFNLHQKYKNTGGPDCFIKPDGTIISEDFKFNGLNVEKHKPFLEEFFRSADCKIYSFADTLKKNVCIDILGLDPECVYGTDEQKSQPTHIYWDLIPREIQKDFRRHDVKTTRKTKMTHRQVMEVVGSAFFRAMDSECWMRATYNIIDNENYPMAIVTDARFPNEISSGTERGGIAIRLTRFIQPPEEQPPSETALDKFPLGEYSYIIDNKEENKDFKDNKLEEIYLRHAN